MAESVIDIFEAVDVEKHHGDETAIAPGADESAVKSVLEQGSIDETRQRVVLGVVAEPLIGSLLEKHSDRGDAGAYAYHERCDQQG